MTDTKFTEGPWEVPDQKWARNLTVNLPKDGVIECPGSGGSVSFTDEVCTLTSNSTDEWLSNAHLIAAGPDMYAALVDCRDELADLYRALKMDPGASSNVRAADAALSKARGEAAQ